MLNSGAIHRKSSQIFRVICLLSIILLIALQLFASSRDSNFSGLFFMVVSKPQRINNQQQTPAISLGIGNVTSESMSDESSTVAIKVETDNLEFIRKGLGKITRPHLLTAALLERERRLPEALIIGVRKGGTRALLDALTLNPRVRVARREVHFFDRSDVYEKGTEWYRKQMPFTEGNQIIIEKTPAYFVSPSTPQRVRELNPRMKLILIVRDPVVRTISDFTQIYYTKLDRNKTQVDFEKLSFTPSNCTDPPFPYRNCSLNKTFKPIRNSLYSEHLSNWLKYFPLEQFLILDGDKFVRDPLKQLKLAERFLGLQNVIESSQLVFNESKGFFCFRRRRKQPPHCLGESKGRTHVKVSDEFSRELAKQFRKYNMKFFTQTNRIFPNWN